MDQNTIDKLRKLYNESTNELAKQSAKKKLEDAGVSLTESAKSEGSKMDQNTIDKLRKLYNESTNDLAKQSAKKKLMDAGVSLSESEGKSEPKAKTKAKKPKAEPKPKSEPKAKTPSKSTAKDDYDCDDLIKKEKERKAKAKANSIKRANAPKKTPTTKNKEAVQKTATKVEKSVQTRAKKGQVKVAELEKLISEYEQAIKRLRALLSKVKSGKKFAEGGNMGMMDSEQSNEYHKIKDHHCKCNDKMEHGGEVKGNKNETYLSLISSERKNRVLQNIAKHYGVSQKEAENEVTDADAEEIYEYIANDKALQMSVYSEFNSMLKSYSAQKGKDYSKMARGGNAGEWSVSDLTNAEYLGIVEIKDNDGEYHNFEVMETKDRLIFGGYTNSGFIESGYIEKDGVSTDEALQELHEELETYYNDGGDYTSILVFNERMAKGGNLNGMELHIRNYFTDVYEDDYEQGEGKNVNSLSEQINKSFTSGEELLNYIKNNILYSYNAYFHIDENGMLYASQLVDEEMSVASNSQIERWKKGQEKLYNANYSFEITKIKQEILSQEELSEILGVDMYAKGGEIKSSIDVDRHYRALPKGKRTSEKVAYIDIRGGGTFTRRNANQYGKTKGGNTYYEYHDNRSDKRKNGWLENGGEINYKKNWEVVYVTYQGKKVTKNITLGRMSTESDVKNSLKEKGLNIQKVVSIKLIGK
jgi:hypothetical protein